MKPMLVLLVALLLIAGCQIKEPSTRPASRYPELEPWEEQDISGGELNTYDPKGMDRDLDAIFNP